MLPRPMRVPVVVPCAAAKPRLARVCVFPIASAGLACTLDVVSASDFAAAHWAKTEQGYTLANGPVDAELIKVGKAWTLRTLGREVALGKRVSFDHAEGELLRLYPLPE